MSGRMQRALSAPGKLFVSGEYAVLWGGTARIAAVGPRTFAQVQRRDDREVHLIVSDGRLIGHTTPIGVNWGAAVPEGFRFAARAVGEAFRAHGRETLGLELALSPSPQSATGRKLGLGGSARTALLAAEAARYVLEERFDALKLALLAHALEQGMKGSGGDVAAIFAGGMIRYRRYDVGPLASASSTGQLSSALRSAPSADVWRVPVKEAFISYAFTGESASTPKLIASAEARLDEKGRQAFVERSDAAGLALEESLLSGDFGRLREAVEACRALLRELGALETPAAEQIIALANTFGGAGKTSGAGGGDVCILFSPNAQQQTELLEALRTRGFHATATPLEAGLRGEAVVDPSLRGWLAP